MLVTIELPDNLAKMFDRKEQERIITEVRIPGQGIQSFRDKVSTHSGIKYPPFRAKVSTF